MEVPCALQCTLHAPYTMPHTQHTACHAPRTVSHTPCSAPMSHTSRATHVTQRSAYCASNNAHAVHPTCATRCTPCTLRVLIDMRTDTTTAALHLSLCAGTQCVCAGTQRV
eukprot:214359-Chlamydomonas_euryale.AAC.3